MHDHVVDLRSHGEKTVLRQSLRIERFGVDAELNSSALLRGVFFGDFLEVKKSKTKGLGRGQGG